MPKTPQLIDTRVIYCGDNLEQLRKLPGACVDLIYIDPPFNSNRNYEVFWGETKEKRSFEDRHASTQAYIDFMRPRCVELARVLKKTGSFYYHCDWHASHYVKVMLDQIFGENFFRNEIVWKRANAHNDPKGFGVVTDSIFFYTGSDEHTWNTQYLPYSAEYIESHWKQKDATGRKFRLIPLDAPRHGDGGNLVYAWKGKFPAKTRTWSCVIEKMREYEKAGKIAYTKNDTPCLKRYLDEAPGAPVQNLWDDIPPVNPMAGERLGYPTQKPLALLERIVKASSNENDIVLDAFCGCGTALVAAQNLKRQWIGIDVSPTACRVMAKRLWDDCKLHEDEKLWQIGRGFIVRDLPRSEDELRKLPPFEFENWAVIALGGIPNKAKVGDMGIDGRVYPVSAMEHRRETAKRRVAEAGAGELGFMDVWYPIQVKQKDKAGRPDIDSFEAVMVREQRTKGFFVSFDYTSDALTEIDQFFRRSGKVIMPLTVKAILDEHLAQKLA
jgi:DNA modification methylase